MEVLLNELSLTGQFKDENSFFDNFDSVLKIIKVLDMLNFSIAKEYMFFDVAITPKYKLGDFLRLRTDKAKRIKRFLSKLAQNPPFWNEIQKHDCANNSYTFNNVDVCNSSLAESCEQDKIVLSFLHNDFLNNNLVIQKNSIDIDIYNIIDKDNFLEHLFVLGEIESLLYCQLKFKDSNLNFSKIEEKYGFDILNTTQQQEFLGTFDNFSQTRWEDIIASGAKKKGLNYKAYDGNWFKNTSYSTKNIFKFRTSKKYRCFGYREKNEFFVLRFEIEHKISDNG